MRILANVVSGHLVSFNKALHLVHLPSLSSRLSTLELHSLHLADDRIELISPSMVHPPAAPVGNNVGKAHDQSTK